MMRIAAATDLSLSRRVDGAIAGISLKALDGVGTLVDRGLSPAGRLGCLTRAPVRWRGEHGSVISAIADTRQKHGDIGVLLRQIRQPLRNDVSTKHRDFEGRKGELVEREVAALDQMMRLVTSPVSGIADQLAIHAAGGVILSTEPLTRTVLRRSTLIAEAHIPATRYRSNHGLADLQPAAQRLQRRQHAGAYRRSVWTDRPRTKEQAFSEPASKCKTLRSQGLRRCRSFWACRLGTSFRPAIGRSFPASENRSATVLPEYSGRAETFASAHHS